MIQRGTKSFIENPKTDFNVISEVTHTLIGEKLIKCIEKSLNENSWKKNNNKTYPKKKYST